MKLILIACAVISSVSSESIRPQQPCGCEYFGIYGTDAITKCLYLCQQECFGQISRAYLVCTQDLNLTYLDGLETSDNEDDDMSTKTQLEKKFNEEVAICNEDQHKMLVDCEKIVPAQQRDEL